MQIPFFATFSALLLASCAGGNAESGAEEPAIEHTGHVVDEADILSPEFERQLTFKLAQLEQDTLVQLVVVTASSLEGRNVADYTRDLANAWDIGDEDRDDGIVILVAPNERRIRIAVGYGLETSVTDKEAKVIIDESILPEFRENRYEAGIDAGVDRLTKKVTLLELREAA
ncbi:MAG: TPM domain-containing protein [Pseudomonadota bacterium]